MSTMTEAAFLGALVERTGCRLLCDVSNVFLSGRNMGYDPWRFIDEISPASVAELHLGGFSEEEEEAAPGSMVCVDTHASPIADGAWALYAYALRRFGAVPTIVEWDNDLPSLSRLLAEAATADGIQARTLEHVHAS
jgi:uncharacterized protein (UPF0276 family)